MQTGIQNFHAKLDKEKLNLFKNCLKIFFVVLHRAFQFEQRWTSLAFSATLQDQLVKKTLSTAADAAGIDSNSKAKPLRRGNSVR